ncbi:MAG: preprotein translocase subunit SecE [Candidatus Pacebacteria bacterium]|nr:preprotein translocase subunit SecE [Candidatus Paceibacterota bacterium]
MNFIQYLRDTKSEMKHVVWPTRRQAVAFTVLVVVLSVFTALYLSTFDTLFTSLIKKLIG